MSSSPPKLRLRSLAPIIFAGILGFSLIVTPGPVAAAESADGGNVTVYRVSGVADEMPSREAIMNGTADPADQVVMGDMMVIRIKSATLAESLQNGTGSKTDRFFDTLDGTADLRIVQTNPTPQKAAMMARLGPKNVSVIRNGNTTLVSVNTTRLTFGYRDNPDLRTADIFGGERFGVVYGQNLTEVPRHPTDPDFPVIELFPSRSNFDDTAWYRPLPPEPVNFTVNTHVTPEREHIVRLSLPENRTIVRSVDMSEGTGLTTIPMDLSSVQSGTPYELELIYDGVVTDRYTGAIREPKARLSNATLRTVDGQTTVTLNANLSHGGSVTVLDEECVGHGLAVVRPNETMRLSIPLYHENGTAIRDEDPSTRSVVIQAERQNRANASVYQNSSATVAINTQATCKKRESQTNSSPNTTTTRTSPETTTTSVSGGETTTTATSSTQTTTPGFGPIMALVAFVAALLLGTRDE